jgi:ABC-type amino acid transport substrate-binding protein
MYSRVFHFGIVIVSLSLNVPIHAAEISNAVIPGAIASPSSTSQSSASGISTTIPSEGSSTADTSSEKPKRVFKIGLSERPPYTMKNDLGEWQGAAIDLWEEIANNLGCKFEYVDCIQAHMHDQLKSGEIDVMPVTAQSGNFIGIEQFTQPYFFSKGGAVITHLSLANSIENIMKHLTESGMFTIILSMFLTMFIISLILLHFEGRSDHGHFEGPPVKRFSSALWYTAVTMTSVGYGDTSRLSAIGRMITFIWMLLGILFVALFTGSVVSAITTADLNSNLGRVEDLAHYRVGVFTGTKIERVLIAKGIPVKKFPSLEEGFAALARGQINAFAGDAVSQNYTMNHDYPGQFKLCVMPAVPLVYSLALRQGDPDFDRINNELIKIVLADDWRTKFERWSGPLPF